MNDGKINFLEKVKSTCIAEFTGRFFQDYQVTGYI